MGSDRRKALQLKAKLPDIIILLKILDRIPPCFSGRKIWKDFRPYHSKGKKGDFSGFWRYYLEEEAGKLLVAKHWDALRNVLSLLIYGLMLFPNFEGFIDSSTINVFWDVWKEKEIPIPPLLDGIFHTLHVHHEKKSDTLLFCLTLLYTWLTSHVFKPNASIGEMTSGEWGRTLVFLS
ncbi:hypothetical protein KIW84_057996 [Lathyrus oleraceus]|uniref:DUF7745 domain-containing protein n=1 Tax=Pisum sativum TaxID=3888 RepID=A0A9D4X7J0_PEA|nr:hypothetical protein KIW84_057996 [Pisum sativum]